jgi:hypothetical protein
VGAVARIDSDVLQDFAFRAEIAVLLGHVGELLDAIEISRPTLSFDAGTELLWRNDVGSYVAASAYRVRESYEPGNFEAS